MMQHYTITAIHKVFMKDDDAWHFFIGVCLKVKSAEEFEQFFDLFLTIEEKNIMASRCKIIQGLLQSDLPQREMSKQYNVSIAQITRGSNALKRIDPKLENFLRKLL
jgi:TrpR family transcriptional regulator, trp operon repressor